MSLLLIRKSKEELKNIIFLGEREGLLSSNNTLDYALVENNVILGMCSLLIKGKTGVFKTAYVLRSQRNKGYLDFMIKERINILKSMSIKKAEANCRIGALNAHLRNGAKVKKVYKNKITKVVYEIL